MPLAFGVSSSFNTVNHMWRTRQSAYASHNESRLIVAPLKQPLPIQGNWNDQVRIRNQVRRTRNHPLRKQSRSFRSISVFESQDQLPGSMVINNGASGPGKGWCVTDTFATQRGRLIKRKWEPTSLTAGCSYKLHGSPTGVTNGVRSLQHNGTTKTL